LAPDTEKEASIAPKNNPNDAFDNDGSRETQLDDPARSDKQPIPHGTTNDEANTSYNDDSEYSDNKHQQPNNGSVSTSPTKQPNTQHREIQ
jgi:hypothetical protein